MSRIEEDTDNYFVRTISVSGSKLGAYTAIISLFCYAFFWLSYLPISQAAESLIVLFSIFVFLRNPSNYSLIITEFVGRIFLVWLLLIVLNIYLNPDYYDQIFDEQITEVRHYSKLFLFFMVAWWLSGSNSASRTVLCLAAFGFVVGTFVTVDSYFSEINEYFFDKRRIDFGYKNAQHTAVYAAFSFVVITSFYKRIISHFISYKKSVSLLIIMTLIYIVFVLLAAETRATIISLVIAYLSYALYFFVKSKKHMINAVKKAAPVLISILVVFFVLDQININPLKKLTSRVASEKDVVEGVFKGDIDSVRTSSIGIRILSWKYAISELEKSPVVGFGPASRRIIPSSKLKEIDEKSESVDNLGHFHNSYIELLFAYGISGLAVLFTLVAYVIYGVRQARKQNIMDDDIFMFIYVFSIYWLIVNLFESYIIFTTGYYLNTLLGAVAFTFYLNYKYKNNEQEKNTPNY